MTDLTTGAIWSSTLPAWQRDYYSALLLETLRTKSILVPFCARKVDHQAFNTGIVHYSEVYDTDPDITALSESDIWLRGAHLDSRSISVALEIHGDVLKFSDYSEIVQYLNAGNMRGLVREKIGQNQVDYLDILARNAFLQHPNKTFMGAASRVGLAADDIFDPDIVETVRVHLEENEIPGIANVDADDVQTIVCATSPRVIKDIRTGNSSKWLEVQEYAGAVRKFTGEVGMWGGVRFVKSNRLRLRNHGLVAHQTTLTVEAAAGSGAAATVDGYVPGQSNATRYITVADETGFTVGMWITIHGTGNGAGNPPLESDGTQETRRIVSIDAGNNRIALNKPLLKTHAVGAYVTNGIDVHGSLFMGGPAVVMAVGEEPHVIVPPKYDDLQMVNRYGWRGFLKFQQFRPEFYEVVESAGSTD